MNITINGLLFQGPYYHDRSFVNTFSCVYAVVDNNKLIYVGITNDINKRLSNHHKMDEWNKYVVSTNTLYIYIESDQSQRENIERMIINRYNPICNER